MLVDLHDTRIAFEQKSDRQLRKIAWLFRLMSSPFVVRLGSRLTLLGLHLRLPIQGVIKRTIFEQFCGGTSLEDCRDTVRELDAYGVETVLDYGAEAKESDDDFDKTLDEFMSAVAFAGANESVTIISAKITGLARFDILEKTSAGLMMELMDSLGLPANHPNLSFCQLYGMSDNITFNLAKAGCRTGKYVPYGPVRDVVPYLVRRARENSSVGGEVSRELRLIHAELTRRKSAVSRQ